MAFYGLYRLRQIVLWDKFRKNSHNSSKINKLFLPVLIQLPVYNEKFVVVRLIQSVCGLDYPKELLEIQVLDDSTDNTKEIIDNEVIKWHLKGFDIKVIRRENRIGFKAGALNHGLKRSDKEYVAVFDADFIPPKDFLIKSMPYMADDNIAFIQARWGFLNEDHSWLTKIQAVFLAAHFGVEQFLRYSRGLFLNFNGTAGIWKKKAIESAGGWSSDTVTEDLDLSFRAYLKGWKGIYLDDLEAPSELPITLNALRTQQKRWAKGSVQTAKKLLGTIWKSDANLAQKFEATMHLYGNCGWTLGVLIFLTLYPALLQRVDIGPFQMMKVEIPLFIFANLAILTYFFTHEIKGRKKNIFSTMKLFILLPAFGMGLAPSITVGILEGLFSQGGIFIRTPKFGELSVKSTVKNFYFYHKNSIINTLTNISLFFYSFLPLAFALERKTYLAMPFLSIFTIGFAMIMTFDLKDWHYSYKLSRIRE